MKILITIGTRPEAIKLAPVVHEIQRRDSAEAVVLLTAQHREMLDQVLEAFSIRGDVDLDLMRPNQSLEGLTARLVTEITRVLREQRPDWVVVQGDTTTAFVGALSAFYVGIPVGHVEAGLRTNNPREPFPEEMNRRLIGSLATRHFAPTPTARAHLLGEGVDPASIEVTGNTSIDALFYMRDRAARPELLDRVAPGQRLILITAHRRESFGEGFVSICSALRRIAEERPECTLIYPVHPNPNVLSPVHDALGDLPNVILTSPRGYPEFVALMDAAELILTDSGGIQEEAPSIGKPVLVMRDVTERVEAVEAGTVILVGTDRERIVEETYRLLDDPLHYQEMARAHNPYGDGTASVRILDALLRG
ncbi:MAG: UDP-N-acetylglucosamine 2-epimerase (non-hydrolyzing) [Myxococcales bacterium]|nr:UDP-N-acetylglucosamine 2-epimerase (non-hydrolyzing) [Myxococcales bacterium]